MRMLCTGCWRRAHPDTWLPGSDRLELAAWLALGVPGLLYCAWRHAGRIRTCPACGGRDLVREARAATWRTGPALDWGGGRLRSRRPLSWPASLASPRARLQAAALALGLGGTLAALLAGPGGSGPEPLSAAAGPLGCGVAFWIAAHLRRSRRPRRRCEAFDAAGRRLPVEILL